MGNVIKPIFTPVIDVMLYFDNEDGDVAAWIGRMGTNLVGFIKAVLWPVEVVVGAVLQALDPPSDTNGWMGFLTQFPAAAAIMAFASQFFQQMLWDINLAAAERAAANFLNSFYSIITLPYTVAVIFIQATKNPGILFFEGTRVVGVPNSGDWIKPDQYRYFGPDGRALYDIDYGRLWLCILFCTIPCAGRPQGFV